MFPLLLLPSTILGYVLAGNPELQQRLIRSALSQFPVVGDQLGQPRGLSGGTLGVVVGVVITSALTVFARASPETNRCRPAL